MKGLFVAIVLIVSFLLLLDGDVVLHKEAVMDAGKE